VECDEVLEVQDVVAAAHPATWVRSTSLCSVGEAVTAELFMLVRRPGPVAAGSVYHGLASPWRRVRPVLEQREPAVTVRTSSSARS
jgi:hypothetical protein